MTTLKFFLHFEQDLLTSNNDTLNSMHRKYRNDGNLTIDEIRKTFCDQRAHNRHHT